MGLELTEREIQIAKGENPDAPEAQPEAEVQSEVQPESTEQAHEALEQEAVEQEASHDGDDKGTEARASWVDSEAEALGKSYGLDKSQIEGFSSKDDFLRAARMMDSNLVRKEEPKVEKAPESKAPEKSDTLSHDDLDKFIEEMKAEGYDEKSVRLAVIAKQALDENKALNAKFSPLEKQLSEMRSVYEKQVQDQRANQFNAEVDKLHPDLFGKSRDESGKFISMDKKHSDNRQKLYEAAETIVEGMVRRAEKTGQPLNIPAPDVVLKRAMNLAFGDDLLNLERSKFQNKAVQQSKTRRSVGTSRPAITSRTEPGSAQDIANSPEIVAAWKKFTSENGSE